MILRGMLDLCWVIFKTVVDLFRPRAALGAEMLVLRHRLDAPKNSACAHAEGALVRHWQVMNDLEHVLASGVAEPPSCSGRSRFAMPPTPGGHHPGPN
jgi:hypothetical protein